MREEDRIFKGSHRLHALVTQANAIQQGRPRETEKLTKFYLGDSRMTLQTANHHPPPLAEEMRGDKHILDMYQWGRGAGVDQMEKTIAIHAGIARKYEQQFKNAPQIQPYNGEIQVSEEKKITIDDLLKPAAAPMPASAQAAAQQPLPASPVAGGDGVAEGEAGAEAEPALPPLPVPAIAAAAAAPVAAPAANHDSSGLGQAAQEGAAASAAGAAAGVAPPAARAQIRTDARLEAHLQAQEDEEGMGVGEQEEIEEDDAGDEHGAESARGMVFNPRAFLDERWSSVAREFGGVTIRPGYEALEIGDMGELRDYLEAGWDSQAGEMFLRYMDRWGRYRNAYDEAGAPSAEVWEQARQSLIQQFNQSRGTGWGVPDTVMRLQALWEGQQSVPVLSEEQLHGRPGAMVGEAPLVARPAAPRREGTDQAPEGADRDDVSGLAQTLSGTASAARVAVSSIANGAAFASRAAAATARGVAGAITSVASNVGDLAAYSSGRAAARRRAPLPGEPDYFIAPRLNDGGSGAYGYSEELRQYNGRRRLPDPAGAGVPLLGPGYPAASRGVVSASRSGVLPLPAPAPQLAIQDAQAAHAAAPHAIDLTYDEPPPAPAAPPIAAPVAAPVAPAAPAAPRRAARLAENPEGRAAFAAAVARSGRSGRGPTGHGKHVQNMARLSDLYEQHTGNPPPQAHAFNEDGTFASPHHRQWWDSHMNGSGPSADAFHAMREAVDDSHNEMMGCGGQMNGCGAHTIHERSELHGHKRKRSKSPTSPTPKAPRKGRFAKGSPEAKAFMASLRAKRDAKRGASS